MRTRRPHHIQANGLCFCSSHMHGVALHLGQPWPYLAWLTSSKSTSAMLAIVTNHANTSANSSFKFSRLVRPFKARASSPTSSVNHIHVDSTPRARSFSPKVFSICFWNSLMFIWFLSGPVKKSYFLISIGPKKGSRHLLLCKSSQSPFPQSTSLPLAAFSLPAQSAYHGQS